MMRSEDWDDSHKKRGNRDDDSPISTLPSRCTSSTTAATVHWHYPRTGRASYFYLHCAQEKRRRPPGKRFSVPWRRLNRRLSVATVLCWTAATAGVCDRERFPYETTGNDSYRNDGDEAAALLVRADCVDIVMDATVIWPHRVCTALCARTGWCRAADTRVHATTTTNDKNNGARVYRTQRTYKTTNERTNKQTNEFDDGRRRRWWFAQVFWRSTESECQS